MSAAAVDPICARSDLPESMCAHCRGLGWEPVIDVAGQLGDALAPGLREYHDPEASARARVSSRMPAAYDSPCPGCGDMIRVGDYINRIEGVYVCGDCAKGGGS